MEILLFAIGIVIGMMIRDIKFFTLEQVEKLKEKLESGGKAQFLEPMSAKEAFNESETLDEFIKKQK